MSEFSSALICGRFQTFHLGHKRLIDIALTLSDRVLVLVGSAQASGTERNPFTIGLRTTVLKTVYNSNPLVTIGAIDDLSAEDEISEKWGEYLLQTATKKLNEKPELMVYGNDKSRSQWFRENELSDISELIVKRDDISATKLRQLMYEDKKYQWEKYVPDSVWIFYDLMREQLLAAK
jgi:nicotinamide-nucleotide adenylyltransferase